MHPKSLLSVLNPIIVRFPFQNFFKFVKISSNTIDSNLEPIDKHFPKSKQMSIGTCLQRCKTLAIMKKIDIIGGMSFAWIT